MSRSFLTEWTIKVFAFLGLLYLLAMGLLYFRQRSIIFANTHTRDSKSGFYLKNEGKRFWVELANPGNPDALIFFPGNAEEFWEKTADIARHFPKYTIYLLHYRGYGKSEGKPSEEAIASDAAVLYD
jgi:pimeloyl-ACP methyl ester carboxylesterase